MLTYTTTHRSDPDEGEHQGQGDLARLGFGEKLPVAGARIPAGELASRTRRYHRQLRTRRRLLSALASVILLCVGLGFFANDYPAVQLVAFMAVIFIPVVVAGTAAFYHFDGKPIPFLRRLEDSALYPPNALADNLREAMQAVLDALARRQDRARKNEALAAQVPEAALAFTAFFGRSVDRIPVNYSDEERLDDDPTKDFQAQAIAFAKAVSGSGLLSHSDVHRAASRLLGAYRRLLWGRQINREQVAFDTGTIDPTTLPRGPEDNSIPEARLLAQSITLLEAEPKEIAHIRETDAELARVQAGLSPEDAREWSRIVNEHTGAGSHVRQRGHGARHRT